MKKECVLEDRECNGCGKCNVCDLDETKLCNSCGKCIDLDGDYAEIQIDKVILDK